uniref:Uncharacterized protein n=1 Tax=Rhizochromulina marina TaxID=1034831 RepID=A0A7S2SLJ6_9STRA
MSLGDCRAPGGQKTALAWLRGEGGRGNQGNSAPSRPLEAAGGTRYPCAGSVSPCASIRGGSQTNAPPHGTESAPAPGSAAPLSWYWVIQARWALTLLLLGAAVAVVVVAAAAGSGIAHFIEEFLSE